MKEFPENWKEGLYQAIHRRRDVRSQFKDDPIPEEVLARLLTAAHHAPSVGFMQPWDFILVREMEMRRKVRGAFEKAHAEEARAFPPEKREAYLALKLEGILESALNLCVTCDRERFGKAGIGRMVQTEMDRFSAVCAVQNLWLAARAEGIGVGWVSIVHPGDLKAILGIPEKIEVIAYLCLGTVTHFAEKPDLETAGWAPRLPLSQLVHLERWDRALDGQWPELGKALQRSSEKDQEEVRG
jgi:5,6-dimethylbenzimidazole synthase